MTQDLKIAEDLSLPIEAVTETFAILAKRGKGKTTTAVVLAEELIGAGQPVVVIDPVGVWWGIRSSADGTAPGLPVVVFGGDHADVPIDPAAGTVIADVLVDRQFPAIIDVSAMSKSSARRFVADFVERLYHRNREPLHVIVDEADAFAPQRAQHEGRRLLGAMEDLVRRGRARGIGVTLITQRPAVLHKDVLTQAEVLVALGMTGPRDVAAIDEWVSQHADEDKAQAVKASLPSLPVGAAWVWSPGWLNLLQQVQIRPRRTFDSSATPKPGERRLSPSTFADVDITALTDQIVATVPSPDSDDPTAMRQTIARLKQQLAAERAKNAAPQRVEVPALAAGDLETLRDLVGQLGDHLGQLTQKLDQVATPSFAAAPAVTEPTAASSPASESSSPATRLPDRRGAGSTPDPRASASRTAEHPDRPKLPEGSATHDGPSSVRLPKAERRILAALAPHDTRSTKQVALLAGYSHKSSGFRNAMSSLRTAQRIRGRGDVTITPAGRETLGASESLSLPSPGPDLLQWWKDNHLGKAERSIVDVLAAASGGPLDTATLAERAGYSATSSGFRNAMSRLRTLGLAAGHGELTLAGQLIRKVGDAGE